MHECEALFAPLDIGPVRLKNRIAMAPMGIDYMVGSDGSLNQRVVDYYLERARHGVGLIICSVFKVENRVEALEECTPVIRESSLAHLGELTEAAHAFGTRVFVQLTAGYGRVSVPKTLRGSCVSASAVPNFWDHALICRSLEVEEIQEIVRAMGAAAELLDLAGIDGIELHGHEGYLFDQFTTALWNRRQDDYGGSLANRLRFPVECLQAIRDRVGNKLAVQYRFGLKHYLQSESRGALPGEAHQESGRDTDEGLAMAACLERAGFDSLHVDAGCYESHYWPHPPVHQPHGCMLDMASAVKAEVAVPVVGVGRLDKPEVATRAVVEGCLDVAAVGRGLLADPQWVDKVRTGKIQEIRPCVACYDGCFGRYQAFKPISCALNPAAGREETYRLRPTPKPGRIMVIGGGVAGMEAARVAALRGHRVSLYEKTAKLGGLLRLAAVPAFKNDLKRLLNWYEAQIHKLEIDVCRGQDMTLQLIRSQAPDAVIIATGARYRRPKIPGVQGANVVTATELLQMKRDPGERVAIIGGGLAGCEIAIWLAGQGRLTTVVEMLPQLMSGGLPVPGQVKMMTLDLLAQNQTTVMTSSRVIHIKAAGVSVIGDNGCSQSLEAETVVLSTGLTPVQQLAEEVERCGEWRTFRVGDCRRPRNVMHAIWEGYEVARIV